MCAMCAATLVLNRLDRLGPCLLADGVKEGREGTRVLKRWVGCRTVLRGKSAVEACYGDELQHNAPHLCGDGGVERVSEARECQFSA